MRSASRVFTVTLLLSLISVATLAAVSLDSLSTSAQMLTSIKEESTHAAAPPRGTLIVQVLVETRWRLFGRLPSHFVPVPDEKISIIRSDFGPIVGITNSSGLVKFILPLSKNYLLRVDEPRFHITAPLEIAAGVTSVLVKANRIVHLVSSAELWDSQSSGWTVRNQSIFLQLANYGQPVNSTCACYLEVERGQGKLAVPNLNDSSTVETTRVEVLGEVGTASSAWLRVEVGANIRLNGISRLLLVSYAPTIELEP